MTTSLRFICHLSSLNDRDTLGFRLGSGDWPLKGLVVRQGDQVFAYLNRCPHAGHPLNWQPNRFLNSDQTHLLCGSHGALFEVHNGACVAGPCTGQSLLALPLVIEQDQVLLAEDPDILAARFA
jgi:nitrite reductase/ring-hydroxylating ferredoxin subunit